MPKGLIIVESPAKASTISKFLKNEYIVKASMGHVRDLPTHKLGVDVEHNFKPKYEIDKKKAKVISELREAVAKVPEVFLASDHDREGEAIAWHLKEILGKELAGKKVHRIVFNEITSKAINAAIEHPGTLDDAKVDSQQARRVLDRVVGYQVSPLLWKVIAKDLSAGRVQSVALRLICEREAKIKAFEPKEYWELEAKFWKDELAPFKASLEKWNGEKIEIGEQKQALEMESQCRDKQAVLSEIKRSTQSIEPPPPFITSTLQQEASQILGMQSQRTMAVAQQLYEGIDLGGERTGLITYMRTDSTRIADEAVRSCIDLISERYGKDYVHSFVRTFKNKSTAQDAHEAIRPTNPFHTPESVEQYLTKEQYKLYTLIWQRFVATQMRPVKQTKTSADITLGPGLFKAVGYKMIDDGFYRAYPHVFVPKGENIDASYAKGDDLEHDAIEASQHFTSPPSRFTEASLIKELEAKGIGRPSTYAAIISTIRLRKYVSMEKKSFVPTDLGNDVNRFLVDKFDVIFNVKFTAAMEEKLDDVEFGKIVWHELVQTYWDSLQKLIGAVDVGKEKSSYVVDSGMTCEVCNTGKMLIKRSKSGEFLACNRYPECKNLKNFKRDKDGNIVIIVPVALAEKCPQCGGDLMERTGKFGAFIACGNYPKCRYARPKTLGIKCPECGTGEVTQRRSKKGSPFFSCTRYPECKWISNARPIAIACPSCDNPYMVEKAGKDGATQKLCPKCKTILD